MIKRDRFSLIYLLLTVVITLSLFVSSVSFVNAWFITSHNKGIQIVINLSDMNLSLYQKFGNVETLLNTNKENVGAETPSYITLSNNEIVPDVENELNLILENSDAGSGIYLRYSLKLIAQGVEFDQQSQRYVKKETIIPIELNLGDGIVENNDYYYYGIVDENGNLTDSTFFEKVGDTAARLTLLTGFTVPYSSFKQMEGSETLKLVLSVEGSNVKF